MTQQLVNQPNVLDQICDRINGCQHVALDTEFIRQSTYRPQLCLIQIEAANEIYCIDALAIEDWRPLTEALCNSCVVIHSARQDIEAIYHTSGIMLKEIFDTQIAASLVGLGDQISYSGLVKKLLDVQLKKEQTRTNWARRPLSAAQIQYAEDDVRHLQTLYNLLQKRLVDKHRLHWHAQECGVLLSENLYEPNLKRAWKHVKGTRALSLEQRRVMKRLASWREATAQAKNKPRKWVMSDTDIIKVSASRPQNPQDIELLFTDNQRYLRSQCTQFWALHQAASEDPLDELVRADNREVTLVKLCMQTLRQSADDLGISPSVLGTRNDVTKAVRGQQSILMQSWRHALVGEKIQRLIDTYII